LCNDTLSRLRAEKGKESLSTRGYNYQKRSEVGARRKGAQNTIKRDDKREDKFSLLKEDA